MTRSESQPKEVAAFFRFLLSSVDKDVSQEGFDITEKGQWYLQDSKLALLASFDRSNRREIMRSAQVVTTSKQSFHLEEYQNPARPEHGIYYRGQILPLEQFTRQGFWMLREGVFDPRYQAYFDPERGEFLDQVFLNSKAPATANGQVVLGQYIIYGQATYKGEEVVEGSRCAKIEIMSYGRGSPKGLSTFYWIDLEHDFLLRRMEKHDTIGDKIGRKVLKAEVVVPKLIESNGHWLPALIERRRIFNFTARGVRNEKNYPPGLTLESYTFDGDLASLPPIVERITITDFKAACDIPAETFTMKWPKGTSVDDKINQRRFMAQADGSLKEHQHKHEEQKPAEAVKAQPEPGAKP